MSDEMDILLNMAVGSKTGLHGAALTAAVVEALAYVAGEIKAGRFLGHRKHAPKPVILHNCKFSIRAIQMLGLTEETQLFALRALYPSAGCVERDLWPVIADLVRTGADDPADLGDPAEQSLGPPIQAVRKTVAVP